MLQQLQESFSHDAEMSLVKLGRSLTELASTTPAQFHAFARQSLWHSVSPRLESYEAALRRCSNLPLFWSNDIRDYIDEEKQQMFRPNYGIAADIIEEFGIDLALERQQDLVMRLGNLFQNWSNIRAAATAMKKRGDRLGSPI